MQSTSIATPSDIVPATHDMALGDGWYPPEQFRGVTFRWVQNEAVIHVASLHPVRNVLRVVVEPGPGVGLKPFELSARDADGNEIGKSLVASKQTVRFTLPPESPRVFSVTLRAAGGGNASPNDPRILNFRVFEASIERTKDVFPAWAAPEKGFYPLEHHAGTDFRWVSGDATVEVYRVHGDVLSFDAESGPGLESKRFKLHVIGPDGTDLVTADVASRTRVRVPLTSLTGAGTLTLRSDGGGKSVKSDPRTLNYRVFRSS